MVKQLSVAYSMHTPHHHTCRCRSVDSFLEPMVKRQASVRGKTSYSYRHVRQGDRLASQNFVLQHYEDTLRQQSSLRDRLPDPTRTNVSDDDWVQDFIGTVYDVMRSDTRTARRKPIRSEARMPEKFSDEFRPALPVPAGCAKLQL